MCLSAGEMWGSRCSCLLRVHYICYFRLHETQMGFVLMVDRRQSGWGSVKTILMRFSVSAFINSLFSKF